MDAYFHRLFASPLAVFVAVALLLGINELPAKERSGYDTPASQPEISETYHSDQPPGPWQRVARPMQWTLPRDPNGRRLEISAHPEICIGRPKPRFGAIRLSRSKRSVIITAWVITFQRSARHPTCMDVGGGIAKVVLLSAPVGSRALYDGSTDPPTRRWPR